ncbi:MAG TPA: TonB-dependent receptor [Vicinamibacterales bacterium]|nr:TonB-dependent receptor [Vicinamibacterales bacterium]
MPRLAQLLLVALCLAIAAPAFAQSQATTGTIEGIVSDSTGAVLPGATVLFTNTGTGYTREVTTDADGRYRGLALPLGTYTISVDLTGFGKAQRENVPLAVGQTHRIDFTLGVAGVAQEVSVLGGSPVVETTRSEQSALIDEKSVEDLPINGRNFIDFVKLAPTVGIVQGPDGAEISINGQRGIYNNVMIDGADANNPFFGEQRGGQRPKYIISLEAVKEFQVVTDGGSAEFGRSAGGFVNMVTKSGTNRLQGTGFYFGRYGWTLSENSDGTKDDDFSQHQWGGSLGGPIKRDRTFFFVSYDQNEEKRLKSKAAFEDPAINPNNEGTRLLNILATRFGLPNEGGAANPMPQTNDALVLLGKVDANLTAQHQVSARYAYSWSQQLNGTFDVPTWTNSANGIEKDRSHSIVGQLNSTLGTSLLNEARIQYAEEPRPRPYPGPDLPDTAIGNFPGGVDRSFRFGRPFFLPVDPATDKRFQIADSVSLVRGAHLFKFGGEVNWTSMTQVFVGFARGRYIFTGGMDQFEAYLNNSTSAAALSSFVLYLQRVPLGGRSIEDSGRQDIPVWEPAIFFQDKWNIRSNITLNLGLRWEGYNSPGSLTDPGETPYARYFSDPAFPTDTGEIPDDWSGWQPRVGITWDPTGEGKTVIRGNAGLFKARTPSLIWANPRTANGVIFATYTGVIVPGVGNLGVPTFPNLVSNPSTEGGAPGIAVVDKDFKNPESRQIGVSVEHEVVQNFAVGVAYNFAKTRYLSRFTDPNVDFSFTTNAEGRRIYAGVNSPNRPFPTLGEVLTTESSSRSQYQGVIFTVNKRYSDRWQMQANWTISDDKSDDDNERDPFTVRYADLLDLESEYSLSDRHSRNRFNLFGLYDFPADVQFSALVQYRSAQPTTGTDLIGQDVNLDNHANDRRFVNGRDVGRNQQKKDNQYFTLDLRVTKLFRLKESRSIEALFEVFNLTNSENNIVSQISGGLLFDFNGTLRSGVGDPRQAQLGVRYRF